MRAGSLCLAPVPRCLKWLIAGHRYARQRTLGLLLEDLPQPPEGFRHLPPQPRARAPALLDPVPANPRLGPHSHRQLGRAVVLDQLPLAPAGGASPATDPPTLAEVTRCVDLDDLVLRALGEDRGVDHERRPGTHANRVHPRQPEVLQEVV